MITNENYAGRFMFRLTECRNTLTNSIAALKSEAEAIKAKRAKKAKRFRAFAVFAFFAFFAFPDSSSRTLVLPGLQ
jgi:hypothetical protein